MRFLLLVALASVALYAWGFVVWGLGPHGSMIWKQAKDDVTAGQMLREQFPEEGTYYVPSVTHDSEKVEELFNKGPLVFVHVLSADGRPVFDPGMMMRGFALNVVFVIFVGIILRIVSLPTYFARLRVIAVMGLACALLIDIGDVVWWDISWQWELYRAFYHFTAWLVPGSILALSR